MSKIQEQEGTEETENKARNFTSSILCSLCCLLLDLTHHFSLVTVNDMASCKYHPDRPGVGVCMRCRAVICNDCCTRLDGVNHCHACLKTLGRIADPALHYRLSDNIASAFFLFVAWLLLVGLFWEIRGVLAP